MIDLEQLPTLHRASVGRTEARRLQRSARAGRLLRLRPGVYVDVDAWSELDPRQKHVLRVRAVAPLLPPGASVTHMSAVAVRNWPNTGGWPGMTQFCVSGPRPPELVGTSVRRPVFAETAPAQDRCALFDLALVDPEAAAIGAALDLNFADAVVVMSHALREGASRERIMSWVDERQSQRFGSIVGRVIATADARHESPAESLFAARGAEIGLPEFVPQHEFRHADGAVDRVDFWAPSLGIVVEVDGRQKYEDPAMLHGRSGAEVLWQEKKREDRIRARPEVNAFLRVTWWHLMDADRLRALFRSHGIVLRTGTSQGVPV